MSIPAGATHKWSHGGVYAKRSIGESFAIWQNNDWFWIGDYFGGEMIPLDQPKPWSGPEDGLPPVGALCEIKQYQGWTEVEVVAFHNGCAVIAIPCGDSMFEYDQRDISELRPIRTPEQLRETAIRELMDIAQVDCRVTAARLVDAGFKREVV